MAIAELIDHLQLAAFLAAGLAAVWQWHRGRTRPAGYLAAAFGTISAALLATRVVPDGPVSQRWLSVVVLAAFAAFPWLLAAFAWSFDGPLPRWLKGAALGVPVLAGWGAALPPLVGAPTRTSAQQLLVVALLLLWSVLAAATARRLWHAGGRQRLVRARMRLMSTGTVLLMLALVVAGATGPGSGGNVDVATSLLALTAAALCTAGFAPPLPLRTWWRRRSSAEFQQMQVDLIASATPHDVAEAIAPRLAELLGGSVAVIDAHGGILAAAQLSTEDARHLATLLAESRPLPWDTRVFPVADAFLVVRSTPYTPVFGQDEHELLEAFSLQLHLALERAELYRSEQRAREDSQAVRGDLESTLYSLSHDLKSPSLAISGFADLLPLATSDAEREEMLGHIKTSAAYLHQLVDALLELSRIGRTQMETRAVDLDEKARAVADRVSVTDPGATVRVEGRLPWVEINPVRAEQLLDNLVCNAVAHAGRDDVTVTVGAQRRGEWLELSIADDGVGIPRQERERIFELFQRGSTSGGRGSGVGLGMVRRIAEACGGSLELVDSEVGARFVVRLPADVVLTPTSDGPEPGEDTVAGRSTGPDAAVEPSRSERTSRP